MEGGGQGGRGHERGFGRGWSEVCGQGCEMWVCGAWWGEGMWACGWMRERGVRMVLVCSRPQVIRSISAQDVQFILVGSEAIRFLWSTAKRLLVLPWPLGSPARMRTPAVVVVVAVTVVGPALIGPAVTVAVAVAVTR